MSKCSRPRCYTLATPNRDDGLCSRHRSNATEAARRIAIRAARETPPLIGRPPTHKYADCARCGANRRTDRLRIGLCGTCRQIERTAARHAEQIRRAGEALPNACSVAGCRRPREAERTCWEHAPRFDARPTYRSTLRAEDFARRTRDPMEGM